jgi:hypothetical protein
VLYFNRLPPWPPLVGMAVVLYVVLWAPVAMFTLFRDTFAETL